MRRLLFVALILLMAGECSAGSYGIDMRRGGFVPQPQLLEPTKDTLDIGAKETVTFAWSPHEQTRGFRSYYDFRLYKGYDMLGPARIMKKEVDPQTFSLELPSSMFDDGAVYTWSLRQVYDGTRKSDRSYSSFKVIKKRIR